MARGSKRRTGGGRIAIAVALTLAVWLAYAGAGEVAFFEAIEGRTLDWRFELRGPRPPGSETVIVLIDDRTIATLGQWPISRNVLARAVDALAADGAKVIAFDLLLKATRSTARRGGGDDALAKAISRAGTAVVPMAFVFQGNAGAAAKLPKALERAAYKTDRKPAGDRPDLLIHPRGVTVPAARLIAAGSSAHVNVLLDGDGSLRFAHPVIGYRDLYFPSLPVVATRLYLGLPRSAVEVRFGEGLRLGGRIVATDRHMRLPVNYYGPAGTFESHSLIDLIRGRIAKGTFKGRIVLIGARAVTVGDSFSTPFTRTLPAVAFFATAIDNLLHGKSLIRSGWTSALDVLAIVLGGLLGAWLAALRAPGWALAGAAALTAAWCAAVMAAFAAANVWLNFSFPMAAILLNMGFVAARRTVGKHRVRRAAERERDDLSRFVSPRAAGREDEGAAGPASDGGPQAAILFVDIAGFTRLAEGLASARTMDLLRAFHRRVERAVTAHQGVIDNFIGDGAMAVFGVPTGSSAAPLNALACARALAADVDAWSRERTRTGEASIRIGVGLHYGPVALGEAGGDAWSGVTVTGDTVNLAARLEALTRSHDVTVIASDVLIDAVRASEGNAGIDGFVELPPQNIGRRNRPVGAWAWPAPPNPPSHEPPPQ